MIDRALLLAYLEDDLDSAVREQLEGQLARDEESLRFVAEQRQMDRVLRSALGFPGRRHLVKQSILASIHCAEPAQLRDSILKHTLASGAPGPAERIQRVLEMLKALLFPAHGRWVTWGVAAAALVAIAVLGGYAWWRTAPRPQIGVLAGLTGAPIIQHVGQRQAATTSRGASIRLGDRITTGDADKAEIRFRDGTRLRLNFNTVVEIPTLQSRIADARSMPRPPEVRLLAGQVWAKVTKASKPAPFAVRTPVATAAVKGTEFGLKLQRHSTNSLMTRVIALTNAVSGSAVAPPRSGLQAILSVKEGAVEFSNRFGKVQATAMTESIARADESPTEPKRLEVLQVLPLGDSQEWALLSAQMTWTEAAERLASTDQKSVLPGPRLSSQMDAQLQVLTAAFRQSSPISRQEPISELREPALRAAALNNLGVIYETEDALGMAVRAYGQAVYLGPQVALYHFNLGLALRKIGSFDRALEELQAAARLAPNSAPALQRLAEIHSLLGHDHEALDLTEAAIAADPGWHGSWELKAQLWQKQYRVVAAAAGKTDALARIYLRQAREAASKAVGLKPDCPVALSYLGDALQEQGQFDEAEKRYLQAIDLDPSEPVYRSDLGRLYAGQGRFAEAETRFRSMVAINPKSAFSQRTLGEYLFDRRQFAEAAQVLRKAAELEPEDPHVQDRLGSACLEQRKLDEAEKSFRRARDISPLDTEAFFGLANVERERHHLPEAEGLYRKILVLEPKHANAHNGLGLICAERGQLKEAETFYRKAMELDPNEPAAYLNLGNMLTKNPKRVPEAEGLFRQALAIAPNEAEAYNGLGLIAAEHGNRAEAVKHFQQALKLEPDSPFYNSNLGETYSEMGRLDEAEVHLRKALELDPEYVSAYGNLGIVLAQRRRLDEAEKSFRAVLERTSGTERLPAMVNLASVCADQGKLGEAEKLLRDALALSPEHPRVSRSLAVFLADHKQKLDEALNLAASALSSDSANPDYLDTFAWVLCQRGELARAEALLKRATAIATDGRPAADPWYHLGQVYDRKGDRAGAREAYEKVLRFQPDHKEAKAALGELEQRRP